MADDKEPRCVGCKKRALIGRALVEAVLYVADVASDLILGYTYIQKGRTSWGVITLVIFAFTSIFLSFASFIARKSFKVNNCVKGFFTFLCVIQMGPITIHIIDILQTCQKAGAEITDREKYEWYATYIAVFEAFFEALPELIFQAYIAGTTWMYVNNDLKKTTVPPCAGITPKLDLTTKPLVDMANVTISTTTAAMNRGLGVEAGNLVMGSISAVVNSTLVGGNGMDVNGSWTESGFNSTGAPEIDDGIYHMYLDPIWYFSCVSSILTIAWAVTLEYDVDRKKAISELRRRRSMRGAFTREMPLKSMPLFFFWQLFCIGSRVISLGLFASVTPTGFVALMIIYYLVKYSWVVLVMNFRGTKRGKDAYVAALKHALFLMYTLSWFGKVKDKKVIYVVYHIFNYGVAVIAIMFWYLRTLEEAMACDSCTWIVLAIVLFCYPLGVVCQIMYYSLLHPDMGTLNVPKPHKERIDPNRFHDEQISSDEENFPIRVDNGGTLQDQSRPLSQSHACTSV